jgi:hypothetical protein
MALTLSSDVGQSFTGTPKPLILVTNGPLGMRASTNAPCSAPSTQAASARRAPWRAIAQGLARGGSSGGRRGWRSCCKTVCHGARRAWRGALSYARTGYGRPAGRGQSRRRYGGRTTYGRVLLTRRCRSPRAARLREPALAPPPERRAARLPPVARAGRGGAPLPRAPRALQRRCRDGGRGQRPCAAARVGTHGRRVQARPSRVPPAQRTGLGLSPPPHSAAPAPALRAACWLSRARATAVCTRRQRRD